MGVGRKSEQESHSHTPLQQSLGVPRCPAKVGSCPIAKFTSGLWYYHFGLDFWLKSPVMRSRSVTMQHNNVQIKMCIKCQVDVGYSWLPDVVGGFDASWRKPSITLHTCLMYGRFVSCRINLLNCAAAYQMYTSGSAVGRITFFHSDISPTPSLILTGGRQKVRNLASIFDTTHLWAPTFRNAARYLKYEKTGERRQPHVQFLIPIMHVAPLRTGRG